VDGLRGILVLMDVKLGYGAVSFMIGLQGFQWIFDFHEGKICQLSCMIKIKYKNTIKKTFKIVYFLKYTH
jgi:hypothetical protein